MGFVAWLRGDTKPDPSIFDPKKRSDPPNRDDISDADYASIYDQSLNTSRSRWPHRLSLIPSIDFSELKAFSLIVERVTEIVTETETGQPRSIRFRGPTNIAISNGDAGIELDKARVEFNAKVAKLQRYLMKNQDNVRPDLLAAYLKRLAV